MRTLIWSKTFIRMIKSLKRRNSQLLTDLQDTLNILVTDPFDPRLKTHKLKGKMGGVYSCSVGYQHRLIFELIDKKESNECAIFLITLGTHDEVY